MFCVVHMGTCLLICLFVCLSVSNLYSGWLDAIHRASLLLLCDRIHCLIWDMFTAAHLCFHHSHLALTLFETIGRIYPFPSAVQRPSYGDCLEVKREYYHNCSVLDCVTQCSQSAAHLCEQFLQVKHRLGLSHWDPYAVHRGGCLELYYCNMVEWFWWDWSLIFDDQLVSFSALTLLVWSSGL